MASRTRASTRVQASDNSTSTSSEQLLFAPSHEERSRESERTAEAASFGVADDAMRPRRLHPYHRSPRRSCHFDGLAAVEVQSIMQMLDQTSLLKLARCSKRMHADADSDAAWLGRPPFALVLGRGTGGTVVSRFRRSLLSHVTAARMATGRSVVLLVADVDAMLTLPHITEINDHENRIPKGEWRRILHHPATAGLTVLTMRQRAPHGIADDLAHLSQLRTLDFSAYVPIDRRDIHHLDAAALSSLPSLTSLSVHKLVTARDPVMLPAIAACRHLTHLRLHDGHLGEGCFRWLFVSPNMSRLQRLELTFVNATAPAEGYADAFAALTDLRHLGLYAASDIDSLLLGLSRAPHLATVTITSNWVGTDPSPHALQLLLAQTEATSRVQVTLRMPSEVDPIPLESLVSARFTLLAS